MKIIIILFFILINIGCSTKKSIPIEFANKLYGTDLTKKGTAQLKGNDFSDMGDSRFIWHKGKYYFQANGNLYRSDGFVKGTEKVNGIEESMFNLTNYHNKLCYDNQGSSVYCLNISNGKVKKSKLVELERGKRISKIAPWVFGNRLLILTEDNELWIVGKKGENPSLIVSNIDQKNISKILVTKKIVYFVSHDSEDVSYFYNAEEIPKKVFTSYINLSKTKYHKDNIITNGEYLFFIKENGSIHQVDEKSLALRSTNSVLINDFHRLIRATRDNILYSTLKKEKIGCDSYHYNYTLYKVNISTGQIEELIKNKRLRRTVGGCYRPQPIFAPRSTK